MRDDVVGELGVVGHTVVRGWMWPGSQRLANQGQGAWPGAVNQEILDSYSSVGPLRGTATTDALYRVIPTRWRSHRDHRFCDAYVFQVKSDVTQRWNALLLVSTQLLERIAAGREMDGVDSIPSSSLLSWQSAIDGYDEMFYTDAEQREGTFTRSLTHFNLFSTDTDRQTPGHSIYCTGMASRGKRTIHSAL